jgi:hypothetical protein
MEAKEQQVDEDHWSDDDGCWNCSGEGYTYDCIDGCCLYASEGCELCERRCWVCNPVSRAVEAPPAPVLDPAAISDAANQERLPEPSLGPEANT